MKRILFAVALMGAAAGLSFAADTGDQAPAPAPAPERASALATSYTAIPRVVLNSGGTSSFIRFANTSGGPANFEVKVTSGESGFAYSPLKPYRITVPDKASLQRSLDDIRAAIIGDGGPDITPRSGDTFLNLYITSDKSRGVGFQHVTYNGVTGFFENASVCTYIMSEDYASTGRQLINVHTSQLAGYPSRIEVHNPDDVARAVRGTVYDAATGTSLGAFTLAPAANATAVLDVAAIERQINFKPTAAQLHINIAFDTADSLPYTAVAAHKVTQASSGAVFNLTTVCKVNAAQASACTAAPDAPTNPSGAVGSSSNTCIAAANDTLTQDFAPGQPGTISLSTLTANDTGASGAVLDAVTDFIDVNSGRNGSFTFTPAGITYTPARVGQVFFSYRLRSPAGQTASAAAMLTVRNPSPPAGGDGLPVAQGQDLLQEFSTARATKITFATLLADDKNTTGAAVTDVAGFTDATGPNGQFTLDADGITYSPARQGMVTFTYRLKSTAGLSNSATVRLWVTTSNPGETPLAAERSLSNVARTTAGDYLITIQALLEDRYADGVRFDDMGTAPVYAADGKTPIGTMTLRDKATLSLKMSSAAPSIGLFTYKIRTDGGVSNPARVTVFFAGSGTAVPVTAPDALTDALFIAHAYSEIRFTSLLGNDTSSGATALRITPDGFRSRATGESNGTYLYTLNDRITYKPEWPGEVIFYYTLTNSMGTSQPAAVTLTVK